jgi:hypothetical protein
LSRDADDSINAEPGRCLDRQRAPVWVRKEVL